MSEAKAGSVTCELCGATFKTVEERWRHNEQEHPKEMARILDGLSQVLAEKGVTNKANREQKRKEMIAHQRNEKGLQQAAKSKRGSRALKKR